MPENPSKQELDRKKRSETAKVISEIANRSPRLVRMVINGEVENEPILISTVVYEQEIKKAREKATEAYKEAKSLLIKAVEKAVPFN